MFEGVARASCVGSREQGTTSQEREIRNPEEKNKTPRTMTYKQTFESPPHYFLLFVASMSLVLIVSDGI